MIRANTLHIHDFRGIRDLTLELGGKNFAVCGPNGTGKSGIVDALEFVLTGNISRLSGTGTGGLSVKDHGPHVDSRNKPQQAFVSLKVHIASLNKDATITRNVKDAKTPTFIPDTADVRAVFARVALHPEFALSRRELIRYVLSEPGKRAKEVQELLRLEEVEVLRSLLQKIANGAERETKLRKQIREEAGNSLLRALGIGKLSSAEVLQAANQQRGLLGLPAIGSLEVNTSLKDGLVSVAPGALVRIGKAQARSDIDALKLLLEDIQSPQAAAEFKAAELALSELATDGKFLINASRESFLREALVAFDREVCPVCDTPWKAEEFESHLRHKLDQFALVASKRKAVEKQLEPFEKKLEVMMASLAMVAHLGPQLQPKIDCVLIEQYTQTLHQTARQVQKLLPLQETTDALLKAMTVSDLVVKKIEEIDAAITALPEPTQQDAARDFLVVAQERLEIYRTAISELRASEKKAQVSRQVFDTFGESTTAALEAIYNDVELFFSKLYRRINHDDEEKFEAKLKPSIGKLGFDVDFYGRGFFPPGAYHSEGHQDGMGLCLYLALMNHLAGDAFTFAVLDDVLMSVDAGHRREVSKMLLEEFPNTQFILTTHDEIWLRHMKSVGLVHPKRSAHFRTWNVDLGPTEWSDREVWEELDVLLKKGDVRAAAALLRHFLEHFSKEACESLRARVEFRGDAQFSLGDLLPNAIGGMKKYFGAGKNAALSWKQQDKVDLISEMERAFGVAVVASNAEQWQVNAAVHYNEWANLNANDFRQVVLSFRDLVAAFSCPKCNSNIYSTPPHGSADGIRCACGDISINLVKK